MFNGKVILVESNIYKTCSLFSISSNQSTIKTVKQVHLNESSKQLQFTHV